MTGSVAKRQCKHGGCERVARAKHGYCRGHAALAPTGATSLPGEEWRAVPGYEGSYEVSNRGRVRSLDRVVPHVRTGTALRRGAVLASRPNSSGYDSKRLSDLDGRVAQHTTHSLVATAFIGPRPAGYTINHKDGDKLNNRVENLEYVTHADNMRHAFRTGLMGRKLTPEAVRDIRSKPRLMSDAEFAEKYGVSRDNVWHARTGKTWRWVK